MPTKANQKKAYRVNDPVFSQFIKEINNRDYPLARRYDDALKADDFSDFDQHMTRYAQIVKESTDDKWNAVTLSQVFGSLGPAPKTSTPVKNREPELRLRVN